MTIDATRIWRLTSQGKSSRSRRPPSSRLIRSLWLLAIALLACTVAAESRRRDPFHRRSHVSLSGWTTFQNEKYIRTTRQAAEVLLHDNEKGFIDTSSAAVQRHATTRSGRMLGTSIGISGVAHGKSKKAKGKGKGKGGSSKGKGKGHGSKSSKGSKSKSKSSKGSHKCSDGKGNGKGKGNGDYYPDDYSDDCSDSTIDEPTKAPVHGFPVLSPAPQGPSRPNLPSLPTRVPLPTKSPSPTVVNGAPEKSPTNTGPTIREPSMVVPSEPSPPSSLAPRCNVGSDGLFGSQLGLAEVIEFSYQTTVTPSVTAAVLELEILSLVEKAMAPFVLEKLFERCKPVESSVTTQSRENNGRRLRRLQASEILGWSTEPRDMVLSGGKDF
jgi:hypothetical protein